MKLIFLERKLCYDMIQIIFFLYIESIKTFWILKETKLQTDISTLVKIRIYYLNIFARSAFEMCCSFEDICHIFELNPYFLVNLKFVWKVSVINLESVSDKVKAVCCNLMYFTKWQSSSFEWRHLHTVRLFMSFQIRESHLQEQNCAL